MSDSTTRWRGLLIGAAVAGGLALTVAATAAGLSGPAEFPVGTALNALEVCDAAGSGAGDTDGGNGVEGLSGSAESLGTGRLDSADARSRDCPLSSSYTVQESPHGTYRASAGNENPGSLAFFEADPDDDAKRASLS